MLGIFFCSNLNLQAHSKPVLEAILLLVEVVFDGGNEMCLLEILLKVWFQTYPMFSSLLSNNYSYNQKFWTGLCISLKYCWTWCEVQQAWEPGTASHKPKKLQTRCITTRALMFIIYDFISCSQVTCSFTKKQDVSSWRGKEFWY